jgi:hypothetical protein
VGGSNLTTVGGVILTLDRFGNSQGSFQAPPNSYAKPPAGLYFASGSFSITLWTQSQSSAANIPIFDFGNGAPLDNVVFIANEQASGATCSPSPSFLELDTTGGTRSNVCSSASFTVGTWYHLAVVYNQATLTAYVYLNGALATSTGSQVTIRNVTRTNNYFGSDNWGAYGNWLFDEIKIHGRALSAQEVLNDFNNNSTYLTFV